MEQGIDRWIGTGWANDITDPENIYMTDGSYTLMPQETYPGKVSWASGDHSAVTTSQSGIFISKWNEYPLIEHAWNYSPYGSNNLKYYARPTISGPKEFCSLWEVPSYTVTNVPAGCTWKSSSNLTLSGSSGNTASVTGSGSAGWVSVNIGTTELVRYDVYMAGEVPVVDRIDGPLNVTTTGTYEAVLSSGAVPSPYHGSLPSTYFDWTIYDNSDASIFGNGYGHINVNFSNRYPKSYSLYLSVTNVCGVGYDYTNIYATGAGYYFSSYPNPASDILNIEIDTQAATQAQSLRQTTTNGKLLKTDPTYDIRLYDGQGNLLRNAKTKGGKVEFNVTNLPNGIYYLHFYDGTDNKPEMRQIVVQH